MPVAASSRTRALGREANVSPPPHRPHPHPHAACAPGYHSRGVNGTKLNKCVAVAPGHVASPAPLHDASSVARECLANSLPDAPRAACLCKPGYFVIMGGQTPRCIECGGGNTFTDMPNNRMTCKLCPLGQVANKGRTGCGEWALRGLARRNTPCGRRSHLTRPPASPC